MAIKTWWEPDLEQRYWMEATKRPVLGMDVRAPTTGTKGQEYWSYQLVTFAKPGDVVFHWHTSMLAQPALVGWSELTGAIHLEDDYWAPQSGPESGIPVLKPHWVAPLGGFHELAMPIHLGDLRRIASEVLAIKGELEAEHGHPIYFPFNGYAGDNSLRAFQGYFTKFPKELVAYLGERLAFLDPLEPVGLDLLVGQAAVEIKNGKMSGQGFTSDVNKKLAVEQRAVEVALEMYKSIGVIEYELKGKPYDIRLTLDGEEVHVEVKGSRLAIDSVLVTSNEVSHAHGHLRTELIVVDAIDLASGPDGSILATGGRVRRWPNWKPTRDSLVAKTYQHALPPLT